MYIGESRDGWRPGKTVRVETSLKATVDDLFASAKRLIDLESDSKYAFIEYDLEYGFPTTLAYDHPDWEDEQWRTVVTEFKVKKR